MTPAAVHHGHAKRLYAARAHVLDAAYHRHPERFVRKPPAPLDLPTAAWINKPKEAAAAHQFRRLSESDPGLIDDRGKELVTTTTRAGRGCGGRASARVRRRGLLVR